MPSDQNTLLKCCVFFYLGISYRKHSSTVRRVNNLFFEFGHAIDFDESKVTIAATITALLRGYQHTNWCPSYIQRNKSYGTGGNMVLPVPMGAHDARQALTTPKSSLFRSLFRGPQRDYFRYVPGSKVQLYLLAFEASSS